MIYKATKFLSSELATSIFKKYSTERLILTKELGDKVIVTLNRPNSLNALNATLNEELYNTLKKFETNKSMVVLKGAGDNTFSTGGDLLELLRAKEQDNLKYFFDFNMYLNGTLHLLHTYKIPVISFMNGFTFGAGTGLSMFSKYSIATEKTRFCMPEARLGSTLNGGATYYFNRMKGKLGYYLALTGHMLKGADVTQAGLATHYCKTSYLPEIKKELLQISNTDDIKNILDNKCEKKLVDFSLDPVLDKINNYFSQPTVEDIILNLKKDKSKWAQDNLSVMEKSSPTSSKVILRQLQKCQNLDLIDCLNMESRLGQVFLRGNDGHEGVRVTLMEKNGIPKWNPEKLSEVTEELIEKYFINTQYTIMDVQRGLFNERYF